MMKNYVKSGAIDFTHVIQRGYVWERKRKSELIQSIVLGYPIPHVYAKRLEKNSKIYYILDGKQRISSVVDFVNDEYKLTKLPFVSYEDEVGKTENYDLSNKKFSELPEELKDIIYSKMFNIIYFDNLTDEEEVELFRRLNAGKPLSTKSKMLVSCKDIEKVIELGGHDLFSAMLSEKSFENKDYVSIIMKMWAMLNIEIEKVSFESKNFDSLLRSAVITESQSSRLLKVFDYIYDLHDELINKQNKLVATRLYTETHMVSLVPFINIAIDKNIPLKDFCSWIEIFFGDITGTSISEEYNNGCVGGSARTSSINKRHIALENSFNDYLKR